MKKFSNRAEAGQLLAEELNAFAGSIDTFVLALPRGGVPVAYEIAQTLDLPLDVFIVRKLGVPQQEELAFGAIASGGITVFNEEIIKLLHLPPATMAEIIREQKEEVARRTRLYRGNKPRLELSGKNIILVDDGIATGATVSAAIKALKKENPQQIILAIPVAPRSVCQRLAQEVTQLICPIQEEPFGAVGYFYQDFSQTSDEEVIELLTKRVN